MSTASRTIARILGPVCLVLAPTEWWNLDVFAAQTGPVVYLNGTLLLVAGVAILQAHSHWRRDWTGLVTLAGWGLALGGLARMIAPAAPQISPGPVADGVLLLILAVGAVLTFRGYQRARTT